MADFRTGVTLFAGAIAALGMTSCAAKPVPIKGVLTCNGKPLVHATVLFISQEADGMNATGSTDASGAFQLTTTNRHDGAMPGTYKVTVHPSETINVPRGLKSAQDIQQAISETPAAPKTSSAIPEKYTRADQTPLVHRVPEDGDAKFDLRDD